MPVNPTTDTGWATYSAGSRLFLPAATNLVTDPQGTAQTLWPSDSANTDLTPNEALPVALDASMSTVTKCIKLVNNGTADNVQTANITVVASTSYRSRLYIYAPTVGGNITITAETGSSLAIGTITVANAGFVSLGAATNTAGGQTTLAYKIAFAGGTASTIYVTAVSLVAATVETPHFDGSYPNCAWTGTAHASTSTRTVSTLDYAAGAWLNPTTGTIAFRYVTQWVNATTTTPPYHIFVESNGGTSGVRIAANRASSASIYTERFGSNSISLFNRNADNATNVAVMRWVSGVSHDFNNNASDGAQNTQTTALAGWTSLLFYYPDDRTLMEPTYIGPVLISPQRKSDAWVTNIQADSGAAYGSLPTLWNTYCAAGDMLIPLASSGRAYIKGKDYFLEQYPHAYNPDTAASRPRKSRRKKGW